MNELISKRLRHRVRSLSTILGKTMTDQYGQAFLDKVEEVRLLAKAHRQSDVHDTEVGDHDELRDVLTALDDGTLISIARAFNQFLNLTNIAEQTEATESHPGSQLEDLFQRLVEQDVDKNEMLAMVAGMHCDLVLTAHPTEITRRTLIQKYNRIATALEHVHEDRQLSPDDRIELERLIAEVWYTDEIRTERPRPQDEAVWGYAVIEHSLWTAIPQLWQRLDDIVHRHTGERLSLDTAPVKISSWMGGDRDGNPNVTSEVTGEVLRLARWMAADLYLRDLEELLAGKEDVIFEKLRQQSLSAIEEDGADVIVLGSTTMHQSHAYLEQTLPVPVVNPGLICYKFCEVFLELGLTHSKAAFPAPEMPNDEAVLSRGG